MRSRLAFAAAVLSLGVAGCSPFGDSCDDFRFDRQAWAEDGGARPDLAERLQECDVLVGATQQDVRELLGPPDLRERDPSVWTYSLGTRDELLDSDYLQVEFDGRGRVTRVDSTLD